MARKKVVKRCPKGHEMDLGWRECPRCTGSTSAVPAARGVTDETVFGGPGTTGLDATRVVGATEASQGGPAAAAPARVLAARLSCVSGPSSGRLITLSPGVYKFGKSPEASGDVTGITLESDGYVSKVHATLTLGSAELVLTDAGSTNGTFVNGDRVARTTLRHGDELRMGETTFRVELDSS